MPIESKKQIKAFATLADMLEYKIPYVILDGESDMFVPPDGKTVIGVSCREDIVLHSNSSYASFGTTHTNGTTTLSGLPLNAGEYVQLGLGSVQVTSGVGIFYYL